MQTPYRPGSRPGTFLLTFLIYIFFKSIKTYFGDCDEVGPKEHTFYTLNFKEDPERNKLFSVDEHNHKNRAMTSWFPNLAKEEHSVEL